VTAEQSAAAEALKALNGKQISTDKSGQKKPTVMPTSQASLFSVQFDQNKLNQEFPSFSEEDFEDEHILFS